MKKVSLWLLTLVFISGVSCAQTHSKKTMMKDEIKSVVERFVEAGATHNVSMYNDLLHPEFRVIANRYPTPDKISIIPVEGYIALIGKKTIGGTSYQIIYQDVAVAEHTAVVRAELKAETGGQYINLLLVRSPENQWQIISDLATQIKR